MNENKIIFEDEKDYRKLIEETVPQERLCGIEHAGDYNLFLQECCALAKREGYIKLNVCEYLETQVKRLEDMRYDINTKCMKECNSIIENIKHTIAELKKLEE